MRNNNALKERSSDDNEEEQDWRTFRARLVQNGIPSLDDNTNTNANTNNANNNDTDASSHHYYAYESTPLVEVGTILVSIPTTDLCQALEQQYWHRSVVLVTQVCQDTVKGELETTVPDNELAQGKNRGRWSYRGVLLNRFTDLEFDGENGKDGWSIHRGGDLLGLDSDGQTQLTCLHHLGTSDPEVKEASTKLVGDLSMVSLGDAQTICKNHPSKYNATDFFTFAGFCSWRPGQLELEMGDDRKEWMALSVDDDSIMQELRLQLDKSCSIVSNNNSDQNDESIDDLVARGLVETGTTMWRNFLSKIHVPESKALERIPIGQLEFYDRMLEIWAEDNLVLGGDNDEESNHEANEADDAISTDSMKDSSSLIGPGTLVRAKSHVSNDMLLFDNEFIKSLVLIVEDSVDATVGVILSHPLSAAVDCVEGKDPLALRYGGPIDVPTWKDGTFREDYGEDDEEEDEKMYEGFEGYQRNGVVSDDLEIDAYNIMAENEDEEDYDDDDDSPFIWIHRDVALGSRGPSGGGGIQLGSLNVWIIPENDALQSLQSGFLMLEDTFIFSGVCIWEKGPDLGECGGGLREQIDALNVFEFVRTCNGESDNDEVELAWDILSKNQNVLTKESLDCNIGAAMNAWEACNTNKLDSSSADSGITSTREDLSDAVLRAWLGVNLLDDPLETFVEVKNNQSREMFGQ